MNRVEGGMGRFLEVPGVLAAARDLEVRADRIRVIPP
jgi:hypothetical protein